MGRQARASDAFAVCGMLLMVANMVWPTLPQSIGIPIMVVLFFLLLVRLIWIHDDGASSGNDAAEWPDIRAVDDAALAALFEGVERNKLVTLLQSGGLSAWAYYKDDRNIRPLDPKRWQVCDFSIENVGGQRHALLRHPSEMRRLRPWNKVPQEAGMTAIHDIHFNRAQLKKHWPDLF